MADAIWNNNYILSNMAASDLYVQSPLTTGMSGTSAYIGISGQVVNGRYKSYDSYNNPNWWTGNNIFGLNLNSAGAFNSTGIGIEGARLDGYELGMNGSTNWLLNINFAFNKFIPINTANWNIVTDSFFSTNSGHFVAPIYSQVHSNWGANFGAIMIDNSTLWTTGIKLTKFEPYSGYTADKVFVNFTVPWVGG